MAGGRRSIAVSPGAARVLEPGCSPGPSRPSRGSRSVRAGAFAIGLLLALLALPPHGCAPAAPRCGKLGGSPWPRIKCTSILVGRDATADHSVLAAHNEDLGAYSAQHYVVAPHASHAPGETLTLWSGAEVPQVGETYGYIATTVFDVGYVPGDLTSGINEYQVAVVNNLAYQRGARYPLPTKGRLLWSDFTRLALERARTARQAVQLVGDLAQAYRLGADSGTMFGVSDASEAWWIEIAQEGQWVAQRVPEDGVEMRANAFRIGVVDFGDPERFLSSPDVVEFAKTKGWYRGGPFDFAKTYGDPEAAEAEWNAHRESRVRALLASQGPGRQITGLMAILRDHYEGTPLDLTDGYALGSPHRTIEYTVCNMTTELAVVFQSRAWLPPEIGAVCWRAMTTPCSSAFVPWYMGQLDVPRSLQTGNNSPTPDSAYWAFRKLSREVDAHYGDGIGPVRDAWSSFEAREAADQVRMERVATQLYALDPLAARRMLTEFSDTRAMLACQRARALAAR
jgi:dipeptidase